ncbi:MAG: sigma-70 family RNA polymerase sigma factor, partial [Clostridiales bacterium]|nr:sigma-70 family RNA polymerase sigma factor [Clostridiales bacterium]
EEHRKAWLLKVTINTGKTLLTSAWNRHRTDIENAENIGEFIPENSEVYYAVQKLPEKYRVVIHLFYFEELSILQICKMTGSKESTIKSQLHRGRGMLKNLLKEEQYEF